MNKQFLFTIYVILSTGMFTGMEAQSTLQQAINSLAEHSNMEHGFLGVSVMNVSDGRSIAQYNAEKSLIPASSLKAITTATLLDIVGPDFKFQTKLEYNGQIRSDSVLDGDLIIKGSGDPSLASTLLPDVAQLDELLQLFQQAIQAHGIKKIKGRIIADASLLGSVVNAPTWQWADLGNYYASGAWGLNIHDNLYYLSFQQNPVEGRRPEIHSVKPDLPSIEWINEVVSGPRGSGDNAYIFGAPYTHLRFVRGSIPAGNLLFKIKGSMPNPPYFLAYRLSNYLEACGIRVDKEPVVQTETSREERHEIFSYESPSLEELIKLTNFKSVNLYAECFLRQIGIALKEKGNLKESINAMISYWTDRGVPSKGWNLEDGSGLSPRNRITPLQLTQILQKVAKNQATFPAFFNSLPKVGYEGTVKYMLSESSARGKIRAKSGSISGVRTYTGYVESRSGKLVCFAIMANAFDGSSTAIRRKMENILLEIYKL